MNKNKSPNDIIIAQERHPTNQIGTEIILKE